SIAGNTTMIHLLLGIIPEYIRLSPYTPAVFKPQVYSASQTGFNICENAPVLIAPAVGSYVGGDITAGLLCTKLAQDSGKNKNELVLFIDIGTNGEIALGNNDFIFACACSAGPAFEGGGIKHGVRAQTGAIERVVINENKKAEIQTIGGAPPIGICGSGIISVVAELFKNGIVDSAGKFPERNDEYILYEDASSGSRITISENDIGNFIRAKGAIFSACQTLLGSAGMSFDNVDKIYVAGGFGRFLDLDDARAVGLLPKFLNEKYVFLGNSSVIGAYLSLVSEERRSRMHELAEKITYMDLSSEPAYMDYYTGALFLPHTDKRLFE
ncbi:MAG: ASKHA domain-containing protein, partial [Treponema sp.]|nr:ASKHA domain-containing protein [Treponema sp.]